MQSYTPVASQAFLAMSSVSIPSNQVCNYSPLLLNLSKDNIIIFFFFLRFNLQGNGNYIRYRNLNKYHLPGPHFTKLVISDK